MVDIYTLLPGMQVKIVDEWNEHTGENSDGIMDKYLGTIVTVKQLVDGCIWIEEDSPIDGRHWYWNAYCIDCVVDEPDYEIDAASDDELLAFLSIKSTREGEC